MKKIVYISSLYKYNIGTKPTIEVFMAKYKKCPRCELNWIPIDEELCEVCKAELGKESKISLLEEDDDDAEFGERICPICKVNFLEEGEDMCASCRAERADKLVEKDVDDDDDSWKEFVDEEEPIPGDEEELSLSQLQDEEIEEEEEEEESAPDDFDDFDYGDVNDYEEDEDEAEDEEDEQ